MNDFREAVQDFLAQRRIAVAGVSRRGDVAANVIYRKLRGAGYEAFAVNPNAEEVEGDRCYPSLAAIPGGVDAVVVATHPDVAPEVVRACAALGIRRAWMHRSFGTGSASDEAIRLGRQLGLALIPGGCPMMHVEPVDLAHRCIRGWLALTGKLPAPSRAVEA